MLQKSAQEDVTLGIGESISAAVDGEMNELDLRRVMNNSTHDAVREKWRHSHLIGAALRGELNESNAMDISAGVWAALQNEAPINGAAPTTGTGRQFGKVFRWAGKSAVAASVALATLVGVQYFPLNGGETESAVAVSEELPVAPITETIPAGFDAPRVKARVVSTDPNVGRKAASNYRSEPFVIQVPEAPRSASDPKVQAYLNNLLLIHAEQSSQASVIGVLPYVRVLHPAESE